MDQLYAFLLEFLNLESGRLRNSASLQCLNPGIEDNREVSWQTL